MYIPLNTCRLRFGERIIDFRSGRFSAEETELTQLTIQVQSTFEVTPTAKVLTASYEPYHPEKDVQMTVPYDLLEQARPRPVSSASSWGRSPQSRFWSAASAS